MATTYLTLTNETLRELNEVQLTSSNFSDAVGIQAFVKESINRALNDIANEEPQLPFFAAAASGETDPFYGNVTVATVAGTRWYTLKSGSSSITTDYSSIDWDDFYITTINVSGESEPYVSQGLKFLTLADWKQYYRDAENADDARKNLIKKFSLTEIQSKAIVEMRLRQLTGLEQGKLRDEYGRS